jgi:type IV secretion system protein VirB2
MKRTVSIGTMRAAWRALCLLAAVAAPELAFAQAASPFETGATNLVTNLMTLAVPIAVILVIALGVAALAGRISAAWAVGVIVGIGIIFASQPIVTWVRGLFGA